MRTTLLHGIEVIVALALLAPCAHGQDAWPQFMRDSAHTGDAASEALQLPLGLTAQIKLDDAVLTSAAVVDGHRLLPKQPAAPQNAMAHSGRLRIAMATRSPSSIPKRERKAPAMVAAMRKFSS